MRAGPSRHPLGLIQIVLQTVVQSLHGRETVARLDVIEVDDLHFEAFGDRIAHHIRTSARNCHKYLLLHHPLAHCVLPSTASRRAGSLTQGGQTRVSAPHTNLNYNHSYFRSSCTYSN